MAVIAVCGMTEVWSAGHEQHVSRRRIRSSKAVRVRARLPRARTAGGARGSYHASGPDRRTLNTCRARPVSRGSEPQKRGASAHRRDEGRQLRLREPEIPCGLGPRRSGSESVTLLTGETKRCARTGLPAAGERVWRAEHRCHLGTAPVIHARPPVRSGRRRSPRRERWWLRAGRTAGHEGGNHAIGEARRPRAPFPNSGGRVDGHTPRRQRHGVESPGERDAVFRRRSSDGQAAVCSFVGGGTGTIVSGVGQW